MFSALKAVCGDAGDRAALVVLLSGCVVGLVQNAWIADAVAILGSLDIVLGEVDR